MKVIQKVYLLQGCQLENIKKEGITQETKLSNIFIFTRELKFEIFSH